MSSAQRWVIRAIKLVLILLIIGFGIPLLIGGCLQLAGGLTL